jgi:hypothetical protein
MTGASPVTTIANWNSGGKWREFSEKVVLWVFMAQNFTFRLSSLVQVLLDFEQKRDFNNWKRSDKRFNKRFNYLKTCRVLAIGETVKKGGKNQDVEEVDNMSIYQIYVEKYR